MHRLPRFVPELVMLTVTAACARPSTGLGIVEAQRYDFRCSRTTVATVTNESDAVYRVIARNGLRERSLGTAPVGETRFSTDEPVSHLYLVAIVDNQPITGRAPGNFGPRRVMPKGHVQLKRECL